MMYNNKLAVAIKANGQVLREHNKDTVMVPFGCEYTILIKNLNTVRAQVRIEIDGTDATDNNWVVVQPNNEVELTRFIKNGNLTSGNRFKFIERTAGIEQHRGIGVEDGLIRIEYQFEVLPAVSDIWTSLIKTNTQPSYTYGMPKASILQDEQYFGTCNADSFSKGVGSRTLRSMAVGAVAQAQNGPSVNYCSVVGNGGQLSNTTMSVTASVPMDDAGITVPGSVSDQKFTHSAHFNVEYAKHVMVIKLVGQTEQGVVIKAPITVKAKPKCITCGKQNKANAKFCSDCGTSLVLL